MDARQQKSTQAGMRSRITPSCKGPRRLAFRIRRRGFSFEGSPSLLITDCFGVWSVSHRRYIKMTRCYRFYAMKRELDPIAMDYMALVRKHKINRWPEYHHDEEFRSLRRKLADFYWGVMPEEEKARTIWFYRERRERLRQARRAKVLESPSAGVAGANKFNTRVVMCFAALVLGFAVLGFVLGFCGTRILFGRLN